MSNQKRVAIIGSRGFSDLKLVAEYVDQLDPGTVVISGGARGVDQYAVQVAMERRLPSPVVIPVTWEEWRTLGRAAGPARNTKIVDACDKLIAFWDGESKGTLDAIRKAQLAGKLVGVCFEDGMWAFGAGSAPGWAGRW